MKKTKKNQCAFLITLIVVSSIFNAFAVEAKAGSSVYYPEEIMLGVFFNSEKDMTDTLYTSFDGNSFYKIGEAYTDKYPNSRSAYQIVGYGESQILDIVDNDSKTNENLNKVGCFHDPGLMYKDGYFWMLTGFTDDEVDPYNFVPMWGYSKDLIHWSFGASGKPQGQNVVFTEVKYPIVKGDNSKFDCVAPDTFLDDNGDVWIIVSAGYFAQWHGDESVNDRMSPYLIKVSDLSVNEKKINEINASGITDENVLQHNLRCVEPIVEYGTPISVNLPNDLIDDLTDECDDRIDGSIYKENGKYYLTIKRNGVTNEIWSIEDLNSASNPDAWALVNSDFLYEYEGPCMTKFNGDYYVYSDKLSNIPGAEGGDNTGIYVSCATDIDQPWTKQAKVTLKDYNENIVDGRHGSVITLKRGEEAYNTVLNRYMDIYGSISSTTVDTPKAVTMNGLFRSNGEYYLYENGVMVTSREIYDEKTDAWYWYDADGTMARSKSVYIPYSEDWSEGKWVYYDENGHMVKGEYHHDGYWYYYDMITGERATGFVYLVADDKWVYYDNEGHMLYGEQCINGNWYRFDDITGKMVHGEYCSPEGNWYYYDEVTGIMHHGLTTLPDGRVYYYNEITGIREQYTYGLQ